MAEHTAEGRGGWSLDDVGAGGGGLWTELRGR